MQKKMCSMSGARCLGYDYGLHTGYPTVSDVCYRKKKEVKDMREIKRYACEFCGTEFSDRGKATACEKSHKSPVEIVRCRYNSIGVDKTGYPQTVTIKMKDGKEIIYKK